MSLVFASGHRPSADAVVCLADRLAGAGPERAGRAEADTPSVDARPVAGFAISHRPAGQEEGWLELLASGLTFDLAGLAPAQSAAESADLPPHPYQFGFAEKLALDDAEVISLTPGGHLSGGEALIPVVRTMMGLGAQLAALPGICAVIWHASGSVMEPGLFIRLIEGWLAGGAFPALGLTALARDPDDGLRSVGLGFFIGQELRIEPFHGEVMPGAPRLALRLIHALVESGPVLAPLDMRGEDGHALLVEPSVNGRFIRVWRKE